MNDLPIYSAIIDAIQDDVVMNVTAQQKVMVADIMETRNYDMDEYRESLRRSNDSQYYEIWKA